MSWVRQIIAPAALLLVGYLSVIGLDRAFEHPPASHASQTTPTPPAPPRPGGVQREASRIFVFVDKSGFGHQHGVEARLLESELVLGAHEKAGRLVFDMNSFDADTDRARAYVGLAGSTDAGTRGAVNANMKGEDVLNVQRYPTAVFEMVTARSLQQRSSRGLPLYELSGSFTLHGTTRGLKIPVEVDQVKGWLHIRGNFSILQSDYGMKPYSKAFGAVGVADMLKIYGDLYVAPNSLISMNEIPKGEKAGLP